jgi:DNA-binding XRE family transcriptional regulator
MKEFNSEQFCSDLIALRGKESQSTFAEKLNIKRPTLSLLENGKQLPTLDILSRVCELSGKKTDDYFWESRRDPLVFLMGSLDESDKKRIADMVTRISIKEKYELLSKRSPYAVH